jgi:hypothetical protein
VTRLVQLGARGRAGSGDSARGLVGASVVWDRTVHGVEALPLYCVFALLCYILYILD